MSIGAKPIRPLDRKEKTFFWSRVETGNISQCWPWKGRKIKGYGYLTLDGKGFYAHRVSWLLFFGEDPGNKCVLHKCDNPPCVNPNHLFAGTHKDNMRDMFKKGRRNSASGDRSGARTHPEKILRGEEWHKANGHQNRKGEGNPCSKLSESDVLNIRYLADKEQLSQLELGRLFNISPSAIARIVKRKGWTHI